MFTDHYELSFEGSADVERGPLGRFVDLAAAIRAEGLAVPALIAEALDTLQGKETQ